MFKDFRSEIKAPAPATEADVERFCKQGEVAKALSAMQRNGWTISEYERLLDIGFRVMIRKRRANEVLSIIYNYGVRCPFGIPDLLRILLANNDIPGFLKQSLRFEISTGFEVEIDRAIEWLTRRGQQTTADAYRRKFASLTPTNRALIDGERKFL